MKLDRNSYGPNTDQALIDLLEMECMLHVGQELKQDSEIN